MEGGSQPPPLLLFLFIHIYVVVEHKVFIYKTFVQMFTKGNSKNTLHCEL